MSIKSREEIIKALELCPTSGCAGCPYYGLDRALAKDDKPVYQYALIFTKRDNLSKWFNANCSKFIVDGNLEYSRHFREAERRYAQERDIKLTLLVRYKCIYVPSILCSMQSVRTRSGSFLHLLDGLISSLSFPIILTMNSIHRAMTTAYSGQRRVRAA